MKAKPFLKWAGGKTQLIEQIKEQIPNHVTDKPFTYIEPFIGGGAFFFWMLNNAPNLEKAIINDVNTDLVNCYKTIQNNVEGLITILTVWEKEYHVFSDNQQEEKKEYFYNKRLLFNQRNTHQTIHSAYSDLYFTF